MTLPHPGPTLSAPDLDAAVAVLREHGLRVSSARRLVLEALFAATDPISAERIATGLDGRFPSSDLASVYRNLETLERLGLVRHFHLGHGPGLYGLAGEEREYLVCDRCGALRSVDPSELDGVRELVDEAFGYRASFKHFPIVGTCADCREDA